MDHCWQTWNIKCGDYHWKLRRRHSQNDGRAAKTAAIAQHDFCRAMVLYRDTSNAGVTPHGSPSPLNYGPGGFSKKTAQSDAGKDQRGMMVMPEKRLAQRGDKELCGGKVRVFVHDGNRKRIPEASPCFPGLPMQVKPLGDGVVCTRLFTGEQGSPGTQQCKPVRWCDERSC